MIRAYPTGSLKWMLILSAILVFLTSQKTAFVSDDSYRVANFQLDGNALITWLIMTWPEWRSPLVLWDCGLILILHASGGRIFTEFALVGFVPVL